MFNKDDEGWLCHGSDDWRYCKCGHDEQQHMPECDGDVISHSGNVFICRCEEFSPIKQEDEFIVSFSKDGSDVITDGSNAKGLNRPGHFYGSTK